MSSAWSTRRRDSQDQLVVLIVETSKLYRPSEPMSNISGFFFVLSDLCYLPILRFTFASKEHNYLHVLQEHQYYFSLKTL